MSWKGAKSVMITKTFEFIIKIIKHCHFLKTKDGGSKAVIFIVTHCCQRHSDIRLRKIFQVTVLNENIINFVRNFCLDILLFNYSVPMFYVIFVKYFLSVYG